VSNDQYILTKKRPFLSFEAGIGTYQLDEILDLGVSKSIIAPCDLNTFIESLKNYPSIFDALCKKLKKESFNFTSLLKNVEQIAPTEIHILKFSVSKGQSIPPNQYILTKKRPIFSFKAGIGTYQLDEISDSGISISIIDPCDLDMFIKGLEQMKEFSPSIFDVLFTKLNSPFTFNFTSLLKNVKQIVSTEIEQPNFDSEPISYDKISITSFISLTDTYDQNYTKLKKIYDSLLTRYNNPKLLQDTYQDFPLLKIDPTLPTLIETGGAIPIGQGGFGIVYKVTINGKQYALKQINVSRHKPLDELMNGEVIAYNTISQLMCDTENKLFCKLIRAYVDFTSYKIYVLMEYCGNALHKMTIQYKPSIQYYVYKWLLNIAKGVKCMHQNEYAHLDIKPDNIVIDDKYKSKIIDFGLIFKFNEDPKHILGGTADYMPIDMLIKYVILNTRTSTYETRKTYETTKQTYNDDAKTSAEKWDVYSLGISFIECAFAIKHHATYIKISDIPANFDILYGILRHGPIDVSTNGPIIVLDIINDRVSVPHNYTLENELLQLCQYISQIHDDYPIFRRMIEQKKEYRCTIDEVISACEEALQTLKK
jgi:hypothetical protein